MVVEPIIGERQRFTLVVAAPRELETHQPSMDDGQVDTARLDHFLQCRRLDIAVASRGAGAYLAQELRVAEGNRREVGSARTGQTRMRVLESGKAYGWQLLGGR